MLMNSFFVEGVGEQAGVSRRLGNQHKEVHAQQVS